MGKKMTPTTTTYIVLLSNALDNEIYWCEPDHTNNTPLIRGIYIYLPLMELRRKVNIIKLFFTLRFVELTF